MDLIERVGAYVGLAAFLGLAVLALLYFSQARDVRRLREWAGRAPERIGEVGAVQHALPPTPIEAASVPKPRKPLLDRIRSMHVPHARYIALIVGGVVILAAATLGALRLTDNNGSSSGASADRSGGPPAKQGDGRGRQSSRVNVNPSDVTVAVLNGTTIAGLAAQVGDEAKADGFTVGTVTNAARTDASRSEVLYRKGKKEAARAVAQRLKIRTIAPVDPLSSELAGSFDVVVLVGADRSG
jgi:hypothetical protein